MKPATWNLDIARSTRAIIGCRQPMFVVDSTE
jgi:hypothetical protein